MSETPRLTWISKQWKMVRKKRKKNLFAQRNDFKGDLAPPQGGIETQR